jgi:hypothetical protein
MTIIDVEPVEPTETPWDFAPPSFPTPAMDTRYGLIVGGAIGASDDGTPGLLIRVDLGDRTINAPMPPEAVDGILKTFGAKNGMVRVEIEQGSIVASTFSAEAR